LETALPLLLNEVNRGHLSVEKLTELTSLNAAKIFKLESKGKLQAGLDADLTVVDFEAKWQINPKDFYTKAEYSPFENRQGYGKPVMTFVRGNGYDLTRKPMKKI
jgi:dihydroorotase